MGDLSRNIPKNERKSEVLGAQGELKSRGRFASLLSLVKNIVSQCGTGDVTFFCIDC